MAKKKHFKKKIQEFENSGFGEYKESTGGGHPFEAGNSNTRTTRENGKLREAENPETMQPRTEDGKFTYKSANGKSIDPKYGPSRGVTVNPLLTGGQNGIKIEDVEKEFSEEKGAYWDKWKDKWYRKSGKIITKDLSTQVSAEAIWETAKRMYDVVKGEFEDESELFTTKTGKKSKSEQAAIIKAKETGEEQGVIDENSGGIELKDKVTKKAVEQFVADKTAPVQEEPVQEEEVEETQVFGSGKYSKKQADEVLNQIKAEIGEDNFDAEFWTDEQLEEFMDSLNKKDDDDDDDNGGKA